MSLLRRATAQKRIHALSFTDLIDKSTKETGNNIFGNKSDVDPAPAISICLAIPTRACGPLAALVSSMSKIGSAAAGSATAGAGAGGGGAAFAGGGAGVGAGGVGAAAFGAGGAGAGAASTSDLLIVSVICAELLISPAMAATSPCLPLAAMIASPSFTMFDGFASFHAWTRPSFAQVRKR